METNDAEASSVTVTPGEIGLLRVHVLLALTVCFQFKIIFRQVVQYFKSILPVQEI